MGGDHEGFPVARFPLPDDWEPAGTTCVRVRIPDDPQYLAMLTALLDTLKWSKAYERDSTRTGAATVARTWEAALLTEPVVMEACMSDGIEFRVSEDCQLQWQANCQPDWTPVSQAGTQYDPRNDPTTVVGWPTVPPGEDGACLSAANATEYFKYTTDQLTALFDTAPLLGLVIGACLGLVLQIVSVAQAVFFGVAFDLLVTVNMSEARPDWLVFDWDALRCELRDIFASDGTVSDANYTAFASWLEGQWGDNEVFKILSLAWAYVGTPPAAGMLAKWAGITDYDCSACDAGWCYEFDFTVSDTGWSIYTDSAGPNGEYVAGVGFKSKVITGGSNRVHIHRDLDMTRFTKITVWASRAAGFTGLYDLQFIDEATLTHHIVADSLPAGGSNVAIEWTDPGSQYPHSEEFGLLWIESTFTEDMYIHKIRFEGDPPQYFGASNC